MAYNPWQSYNPLGWGWGIQRMPPQNTAFGSYGKMPGEWDWMYDGGAQRGGGDPRKPNPYDPSQPPSPPPKPGMIWDPKRGWVDGGTTGTTGGGGDYDDRNPGGRYPSAQDYWNMRNQATSLSSYNPNGMGNWNPWANYGSSAMGGFQGGLGRPGLGYGTNPNAPTYWQGLGRGASNAFTGTNPWAGQTTNYIRRPSGGRVPR